MNILTDDNLSCNCDHNLHIEYDWAVHTELVDMEAAHNAVVAVAVDDDDDDDDEAAEEEEEVAGSAEEEAGDQDRWSTSSYFKQELLLCSTPGIVRLFSVLRISIPPFHIIFQKKILSMTI